MSDEKNIKKCPRISSFVQVKTQNANGELEEKLSPAVAYCIGDKCTFWLAAAEGTGICIELLGWQTIIGFITHIAAASEADDDDEEIEDGGTEDKTESLQIKMPKQNTTDSSIIEKQPVVIDIPVTETKKNG